MTDEDRTTIVIVVQVEPWQRTYEAEHLAENLMSGWGEYDHPPIIEARWGPL